MIKLSFFHLDGYLNCVDLSNISWGMKASRVF